MKHEMLGLPYPKKFQKGIERVHYTKLWRGRTENYSVEILKFFYTQNFYVKSVLPIYVHSTQDKGHFDHLRGSKNFNKIFF